MTVDSGPSGIRKLPLGTDLVDGAMVRGDTQGRLLFYADGTILRGNGKQTPTAMRITESHPTVYDDFARADAGGLAMNDIGADFTGVTWQTTGAGLPRIRDQRLRSVSTGYMSRDLKRMAREMGAGISFTPGSELPYSGVVLIMCDIFNIPTWNAIHVAFHSYYANVQKYVAGVITTIETYNYPTGALPLDGETVRRCAIAPNGSELLVEFPDRTIKTYTDAAFSTAKGVHVWEIIQRDLATNPNDVAAQIDYVWAQR